MSRIMTVLCTVIRFVNTIVMRRSSSCATLTSNISCALQRTPEKLATILHLYLLKGEYKVIKESALQGGYCFGLKETSALSFENARLLVRQITICDYVAILGKHVLLLSLCC